MKKILFVIILLIFVMIPNFTYCTEKDTDLILQEQQEKFGINDFIKEAEHYSKDIFDDINIKDMLDSALKGKVNNSNFIKKLFSLLIGEITYNIKDINR